MNRARPGRTFTTTAAVRTWLVLAAAGALIAAILVGAIPASAHANLLFASPAFDSTVLVAPTTLILTFDDRVAVTGDPIELAGPDGAVTVGDAALTQNGHAVQVPVHGDTAPGVYTVTWTVTANDGERMAGSYRFGVGPEATALDAGQETLALNAWPTGVLRGLLFAGLAVALGEAGGRRLLSRLRDAPSAPRPWLAWSVLLGLGASLGLALLLLGGGSLSAAFGEPDFGALVGSRPGILASCEVAGFALAVTAVMLRRSRWIWMPLTVVVVAEALRAHPGIVNSVIGVPLTAVHLGAAALWVGTLVYMLRTALAWRHHPALARTAIAAYARPAIWGVVAVTVTGLASALLLVPMDQLLTTDYGVVLVIKIAIVILAAGLALLARRRLRRGSAVERIRRPAWLEVISLSGVLVLSVALTLLPPPASAKAALELAPPATGLTVPAAALAGEVQVNAQASASQLVVRMDSPELTDRRGQTLATTFTLSGAMAGPTGTARQLVFRPCGTGCFFSPVTWRNGTNLVTLSPTASGSSAEQTGLTIAWPPVPAGTLLADSIAATQAAPELILYERVTSDTGRGPGALKSFPMSGADFVRHSLFASGVVPAAVRLPDVDGNRRIAISYPAENAVDELTIAPDGRIVRESLIAPNHLISHTLVYSDMAR